MGSSLRLKLLPLRIPYRPQPDQYGSCHYSVMLNVQFSLPKPNSPRTKRIECVIDSGASCCLFHSSIADHLGLDLKAGRVQMTNGIGGIEETWLHDISLFIPGGPIQITAGFKENLSVAGLLGMTGFFEHFRVTFDSAAKECVLERIFQA